MPAGLPVASALESASSSFVASFAAAVFDLAADATFLAGEAFAVGLVMDLDTGPLDGFFAAAWQKV